jgi:hypothetical protein
MSPSVEREIRLGVGQAGVFAEELELAAVIEPLQFLQEAPPKQP